MVEKPDIELLRDYALANSESAFATLVERHIRLVYSAAIRQLSNIHQAEEVTQAVFIILARKAANYPAGTPLSGWLYQTARLTAANLLRGEMRRRRREQEAHMESKIRESHSDPAWQGLAPLLEEAMGRLSATERNAIVVRFFEGRSFSEAAVALGSNEAAVQKRVGRGVEKLRAFFAKRGVKISAGALVALITANSLQAAPAGLTLSVTASAVAKGAAASHSTATLIKGALKIMAWTKAKTAILAGAGVFLAAGTITLGVNRLMDKSIRTMPSDWTVLAGDVDAWRWASGKISVHDDFGDCLLVSGKDYGDFTMSLNVNALTREASVAFRMQDVDHGYLVIFCPAGTDWAKNHPSYFTLAKRFVDDKGRHFEQTLATFYGKDFNAMGPRAHIEISAHGQSLEVRLNGAKTLKARDGTYLTGHIGFRTAGDLDVPSDAVYSKVIIR